MLCSTIKKVRPSALSSRTNVAMRSMSAGLTPPAGSSSRTSLGSDISTDARNLSYGQQKLLELAAVLMAEPDLVMLDEPAGGVNPALIERIATLVRELNAEGRTFLIVEHNMELVMSLSDHVVVFDRGRPIAEGAPDTVRADPAVLEAYLGV